jgi:hypothetical protein
VTTGIQLPLRRWALLLLLIGVGCRTRRSEPESVAITRSTPVPPALERTGSGAMQRATYPFATVARCRVDHGGLFVDLGSDSSQARNGFTFAPRSDVTIENWSDQSYSRFGARDLEYDFWSNEAARGLVLRVRAKAGSAGTLSASVDQYRLGTLRVRADAFHTLNFPALDSLLGPGRHQLRLRWAGHATGDAHAQGMAEWFQWAVPGQSAAAYRAPRQRSLISDMVIGGIPRRSVVLEPPASLGCPVQLGSASELRFGLGFSGEGSALARVFARRDGVAPELLFERNLGAASTGPVRWDDVTLDLSGLGSELVDLELAATSTSASSRVAFSDPRIESRLAPSVAPSAGLVVMVIASGLQRELLPPFEGTRRLRHLTRLAEASVRFPEYRVPTSVTAGVVASLLSGLPPSFHQLQSPKARLPGSVQLLSERIHENSGESAFFTGVPQTRAVFGFDRGWNRYEAFSPVSDIPAAAPLAHARSWLEEALGRDRATRRLLVVQVRGGHPPWDVSREEVAELEPHEYTGLLEARRGGILLANLRANPKPAQRRLAPADWVRLRALELAALGKQDDALGELLELLERTGLWDQTLFVFTGDVAAGDPPEVPFGEAHALTEDRLLVPLWIKFPGGAFAGHIVPGLVTSTDVAATLGAALGLPAPPGLEGLDLYRLAAGDGPPVGRPLLALLGPEYAMRWGPWLLHGTSPRTPTLCDLGVDPACANDVLDHTPLAGEALWRATFEEQHRQETPEGAPGRPAFAPLDRDTAAAVQVWGD